MNSKPYLFILAGGRGERLWPLSAGTHCKPFLKLFEGKTLLERTVARVQSLTDPDRLFIITAEALRDQVRQTLPHLPEAQILCEAAGRNTAAAIALACGITLKASPEAVAIVLPADHLIADEPRFREVLNAACAVARQRKEIVTLGIQPSSPSPEYGYIACADPELQGDIRVQRGKGFTEKPSIPTAETYLKTGQFLWNAGIFAWEAQTLAAMFQRYAPEFAPLLHAPETHTACYPQLPSIAFDRAIMEKCPAFSVVCGDFGWDDAGTFQALERHLPADTDGNRANTDTRFHGSAHCTVWNTAPEHTLVLAACEALFVAHSPEVTLICPQSKVGQLSAWRPDALNLPSQVPPVSTSHSPINKGKSV